MPDIMAAYALPAERKRVLTFGEKRLARSVFSYGLDPDLVHIHNEPYFMFQSRGVAMTPNGDIYFNHVDYKKDFSLNVTDAAWLVHELTHTWQYQTNRSVRMRGLLEQIGRLRGNDPYAYGKLDPKRRFDTYKNEQQAAMVEDYYRLRHHLPPRYGLGSPEDYERAIPFVHKTIATQRVAKA